MKQSSCDNLQHILYREVLHVFNIDKNNQFLYNHLTER